MAYRGWTTRARSMWLLLPAPVRALPADLAAVVAFVVLTCLAVLVPGVNETPLRIMFGLPFVLFLPGYALIAALFPEEGSTPTDDRPDQLETETGVPDTDDVAEATSGGELSSLSRGGTGRGIDGIERTALSFGLSIAVVPLLGLVLNFTPWGIRLLPILITVAGFTLAMTAVAAVRRQELPESERFSVPYRSWLETGRGELVAPETRLDGVLNVLLVCSILLAVGSVAYAVAVPPQGEQFTEFYVLTEDEDGTLVAADYPTEFTVGQSQPIVLGVGNNEAESVEYTVVVQLQEVETENNETTVRQRETLDRLSTPSIDNNETWQQEYRITPTMAGENLRVQFLLYRGEVPANPTGENAYRELHLWIDVTGG